MFTIQIICPLRENNMRISIPSIPCKLHLFSPKHAQTILHSYFFLIIKCEKLEDSLRTCQINWFMSGQVNNLKYICFCFQVHAIDICTRLNSLAI